ncbi:halocyanin domain-containing protein [Haloprofundus salilacus]|uniref:halocyanin domain-containing protein n=1 Tax=Haloprofundus salilacus TaxID=2876190 RepID=UPI003CCE1F6A
MSVDAPRDVEAGASVPRATRRTVLRGLAVGAGVTAAGAGSNPVGVAAASKPDYGGWFDGVDNFDGTVDKRGESTVTVTVGAEGNGGAFGFAPAAVRVDPGTTVVWKWSGEGGVHNVAAEDRSFESELVGDAGHTFEQTFDEDSIVKYACVPHQAMGMKGAVVVDGGPGGTSSGSGASGGSSLIPEGDGLWFGVLGGSLVAGALSPTLFGLFLLLRSELDESPPNEGGDDESSATYGLTDD